MGWLDDTLVELREAVEKMERGECCDQCRNGNTADCDVNPLYGVKTLDEARERLAYAESLKARSH
jgi:hypothetical protein